MWDLTCAACKQKAQEMREYAPTCSMMFRWVALLGNRRKDNLF